MGKSFMFKYRVQVSIAAEELYRAGWHGRATAERLEKYIADFIDSLKVGGCNYHISKQVGWMPIPSKAEIINQKTGEVVAVWNAPKFMVIGG